MGSKEGLREASDPGGIEVGFIELGYLRQRDCSALSAATLNFTPLTSSYSRLFWIAAASCQSLWATAIPGKKLE
jgi:hypothetical protein